MVYTLQSSKLTRKQKAKRATAWMEHLAHYGINGRSTTFQPYQLKQPTPLRDGAEDFKRVESLQSTEIDTFKPKDKVYTGTAMIGIATMHKSNSVPVFSAENAVDISKMRRG